jgi:(2Fe-2S) ferredoxin
VDRRTGVVLCRGCCCGSERRDPDTDHAAQLAAMQLLAHTRPERITLRTSECLGSCAQANVLVVRPSPAGRRRGGRPVWFGFVGDLRVLDLLEHWLTAGGPGLAALPDELELHVVATPRGS